MELSKGFTPVAQAEAPVTFNLPVSRGIHMNSPVLRLCLVAKQGQLSPVRLYDYGIGEVCRVK